MRNIREPFILKLFCVYHFTLDIELQKQREILLILNTHEILFSVN